MGVDRIECESIASGIDRTAETVAKSVGGAALGSTAVAGVASAVAGAVFAPAIPFIIAGGTAAGGLWGASTKSKEKQERMDVMQQCMTDRGYTVYQAR